MFCSLLTAGREKPDHDNKRLVGSGVFTMFAMRSRVEERTVCVGELNIILLSFVQPVTQYDMICLPVSVYVCVCFLDMSVSLFMHFCK